MVTILHTVTLRIYIKCNKKKYEYSCVASAGIIVGDKGNSDAFIIFFWLDVFYVVSSVCTVVNYLSGKRTKTTSIAYLLWAAVL